MRDALSVYLTWLRERTVMMAWGPEFTRQELLQELESRSRERWGAERLAALGPTMSALSDALWLLGQQSLAPTDEPPDFLSGIGPSDG